MCYIGDKLQISSDIFTMKLTEIPNNRISLTFMSKIGLTVIEIPQYKGIGKKTLPKLIPLEDLK